MKKDKPIYTQEQWDEQVSAHDRAVDMWKCKTNHELPWYLLVMCLFLWAVTAVVYRHKLNGAIPYGYSLESNDTLAATRSNEAHWRKMYNDMRANWETCIGTLHVTSKADENIITPKKEADKMSSGCPSGTEAVGGVCAEVDQPKKSEDMSGTMENGGVPKR